MNHITVTEDIANCPQCGAPAAKVSRCDRSCWHCGIRWTYVPPGDEDDEEELRKLNSRAFAEEQNGTKPIRGMRW